MLAAAIAVGGVFLSGAGYGVHELVVGSPAPKEVREQPARFGHSAELIPIPHPDEPQLQQAKVAAVLDSSVGRVYLFSSPSARGLCASSWIEGDRGYQGRLNMTGVCGAVDQSFYVYGSEQFRGKTVRLFSGRAGPGVVRIALRFGTRIVNVPLVGRWFLAEFTSFPALPDEFLSYDRRGHVLERHRFPQLSELHGHPVPNPYPVTPARVVARIRARNGTERITLSVAGASGGGYCITVRSNRTPANSGCSVPVPGRRQMGVAAMNFGGAPTGTLLLVGPVGSGIATLQLRYQDGRVVRVALYGGWALYEIKRADYAVGRRPEVLIGRDAAGRLIASSRLPWAIR